nr:ribonuclease H-like domain-containing protein [Tanacetum cinerariifolium]
MSDHEDETITVKNAPPKNVPQITTVTNISAKFHYLKKGEYDILAMKMQNFISSSDVLCWNIKFKEFKVSKEEGLDKGYDKMQKILTQMNTLKIKLDPEDVKMKFLRGLPSSWSGNSSYGGYTTTLSTFTGSSSSKGSSKSKCSVVDDVIYSFFANHEIDQQLVYEDLDQMNKDKFEEYDLKHQMAMLSIKKYKSKEAGKNGTDSKVMVIVDGSIDWDKQTEEGNTEPRALENFGLIARIRHESDTDSQGAVVSADSVISADGSVLAGTVAAAAAVSPSSDTEFALMGHSTEAKWNNSGQNLYNLIDSSMSVRIKQGLGIHKYIREEEMGIDDSVFSIFHTNSDDLEGQPIYNKFASVDNMKAVPPPLTENYMPPSNIPDIDESQMVYGKKATDSSKIKTNDDSITYSNDSVLFDFSDRSSNPYTNDFQTCDSSQECSRPNHSDHDSNDSISSVSAPSSESSDTIVTDCASQEDFSSVCPSSIETDVKSSKTLCNKFGSFNKGSHFRKHKSCYVCGSYLHLIKDCDLHEERLVKRHAKGKGILGRRPTGKTVNPNKPKPVSASKLKPVCAGKPKPVFAGYPKPIFARQQNTVSAGPPNPVYAGDGLIGPRPLNIQPMSTYFHSFTHNNQQIIFPITHNSLYSLYMIGRLNGKTDVKPSTGWPWTKYGMLNTKGSKINGGSKSNSWFKKAKDKGIVDSGCSQSMSENKDKLEDFKAFEGGEVTFGGSSRKISGKGTIKTKTLNFENVLYVEELQHFNLISVSQICDQTHRVLFTKNECLVLSKDFSLPDPHMVIISIPRKHNLYTFSLNELALQGPLTCLIAKASQNESTLWNRRLGPVNFRNTNKLVKGNLVRGLPFKAIRCDNGTEFKNANLIELCGSKGIRRDYSNPRTPQQNGVAKRKNQTLIEASRTMLADSYLPTIFWTEAVATACYVLNRVLVTKPHAKTPYKLLTGNKPSISYLKPSGYHVTFLNTVTHWESLIKMVPIVDEATIQHAGINSDQATTNVDNLDEFTELQSLQRQEQVGTEEADRLGLTFPSLNPILDVDSASIGSFVSAGATPPVSAGSTRPMSPCASPISADRPSISAGKSHVPVVRPSISTGRSISADRSISTGIPVSAGRPSCSAVRTPILAGRILGKVTESTSSD